MPKNNLKTKFFLQVLVGGGPSFARIVVVFRWETGTSKEATGKLNFPTEKKTRIRFLTA